MGSASELQKASFDLSPRLVHCLGFLQQVEPGNPLWQSRVSGGSHLILEDPQYLEVYCDRDVKEAISLSKNKPATLPAQNPAAQKARTPQPQHQWLRRNPKLLSQATRAQPTIVLPYIGELVSAYCVRLNKQV